MADMKVFVDGALAYSPRPGAPNAAITVRARKFPGTRRHVGYALLEIQAESGSFYADVTVDRNDGVLALYGQLEDIPLSAEERRPIGLLVNLMLEGDTGPTLPRSINFAFRDAAGTSLGSFRFQFNCRAVQDEALFDVKRSRLPELDAEPGRSASVSFDIETLQPGTNSVGYAISPWSPATPAFTHVLQQTANRYQGPDGPIVEAVYRGITGNFPTTDVFILEGKDSLGQVQTIPFISWLVDTPARGELRIAAFEPDPAGRDRGAETITLQNVSGRTLNLTKCYLEDEQRMSFLGLPLNLPYGTPQRHVIAAGRLNPGDSFVVKPSFTMNNDFDAFMLRNRKGRRLDFVGYLRRLPGLPPPTTPRQRVLLRQTLRLTGRSETIEVNLPTPLEDGDVVLIRPDPASRLWSGEIPHPDTGPEGWLGAAVPGGWSLPLPSAPLYALLMAAAPEPRLIGNAAQAIIIDRQSKVAQGLGAGTRIISFQRNDPYFNRALTWGQFDIDVVVLRH